MSKLSGKIRLLRVLIATRVKLLLIDIIGSTSFDIRNARLATDHTLGNSSERLNLKEERAMPLHPDDRIHLYAYYLSVSIISQSSGFVRYDYATIS